MDKLLEMNSSIIMLAFHQLSVMMTTLTSWWGPVGVCLQNHPNHPNHQEPSSTGLNWSLHWFLWQPCISDFVISNTLLSCDVKKFKDFTHLGCPWVVIVIFMCCKPIIGVQGAARHFRVLPFNQSFVLTYKPITYTFTEWVKCLNWITPDISRNEGLWLFLRDGSSNRLVLLAELWNYIPTEKSSMV